MIIEFLEHYQEEFKYLDLTQTSRQYFATRVWYYQLGNHSNL
jgi:hypothetical protein